MPQIPEHISLIKPPIKHEFYISLSSQKPVVAQEVNNIQDLYKGLHRPYSLCPRGNSLTFHSNSF